MAIKLNEGETDQETFDFVVGKLRDQGEPSVVALDGMVSTLGSYGCTYGNPGGPRCAAGHLFGEEFLRGMESTKTIGHLVEMGIVEPLRNPRLIREMQLAHDLPALGNGRLRGKEWARVCAQSMCLVAHRYALSPASAMAWLQDLQ